VRVFGGLCLSILLFVLFTYDWKESMRCYEIYRGMAKAFYTQQNTEKFLQICGEHRFFGIRQTRPHPAYNRFLPYETGPFKYPKPPNPGSRELIHLSLERYVKKFGAKNTFGNVDVYCMTMGPEEQKVCF
jgi:hypothetical protein